jgi:hypothetical protein
MFVYIKVIMTIYHFFTLINNIKLIKLSVIKVRSYQTDLSNKEIADSNNNLKNYNIIFPVSLLF